MASSSSSLTLDSAIQDNNYTHASTISSNLVPPRNAETTDSVAPNSTVSVDDLLNQLDVETKIADGAQHLLQLFENDPQHNSSQTLKNQVENELTAANDNIEKLERLIQSVSIEQGLDSQDQDRNRDDDQRESMTSWQARPFDCTYTDEPLPRRTPTSRFLRTWPRCFARPICPRSTLPDGPAATLLILFIPLLHRRGADDDGTSESYTQHAWTAISHISESCFDD